MTAYKATLNMKCRDFTYEVGKTYSISKLKICKIGFHYCPKMVDTLRYYNYHPTNFILLEVEVLGNVKTKDDKGATDKIKVLRIVPKEEYDEDMIAEINRWVFDDKGNKLSYTDYNGRTASCTYDDKGNKLSHKHSNGMTESWTYDELGNILSYTDYDGKTESWTYDDKGNKLSYTINNKLQ